MNCVQWKLKLELMLMLKLKQYLVLPTVKQLALQPLNLPTDCRWKVSYNPAAGDGSGGGRIKDEGEAGWQGGRWFYPPGSCKFRSSICWRCRCCLISSCQGFLAKFNKNFMSLKRMFMEIFHLNLRKVINVNRIPEKVRQQNSSRQSERKSKRWKRATSCTQSCRSESQQCG